MEAAAAQHSVFGDALSALYDRDDKIIELRLLVKKWDQTTAVFKPCALSVGSCLPQHSLRTPMG